MGVLWDSFFLRGLVSVALLSVCFACVESGSSGGGGDSGFCDPMEDDNCLCVDDEGFRCPAGETEDCVCRFMGTGPNSGAPNRPEPEAPEVPMQVPSPTSVTFSSSGSNSSTEYRASLCLVDNNNAFAGFTLTGSRCADEEVVLGFTVLASDRGLTYVSAPGEYSITSNNAGEFGEGPFPGTRAFRLPTNGVVSLVMQSSRSKPQLEMDVTLTLEGNSPKVTIEEVLVSRL